jgi:hypothetical protein
VAILRDGRPPKSMSIRNKSQHIVDNYHCKLGVLFYFLFIFIIGRAVVHVKIGSWKSSKRIGGGINYWRLAFPISP